MGIPTDSAIADNVRTQSTTTKLVAVHLHRTSPIAGVPNFYRTCDVAVTLGVPALRDITIEIVDWASIVHKEDNPGDHLAINARVSLIDTMLKQAAEAAIAAAADQPDGWRGPGPLARHVPAL